MATVFKVPPPVPIVGEPIPATGPDFGSTIPQPGLGTILSQSTPETAVAGLQVSPPADDQEREQRVQGWKAFLQDPQVKAALLQFGIQALQPVPIGQTTLGHIAGAIGAGGEAAQRVQTAQEAEQQQQLDNELAQRRVKAVETQAEAAKGQVNVNRQRLEVEKARNQQMTDIALKRLQVEEQKLATMKDDATRRDQLRQIQLVNEGLRLKNILRQAGLEEKRLEAATAASVAEAAYKRALARKSGLDTADKVFNMAEKLVGPSPDPLSFNSTAEYNAAVLRRAINLNSAVRRIAQENGIDLKIPTAEEITNDTRSVLERMQQAEEDARKSAEFKTVDAQLRAEEERLLKDSLGSSPQPDTLQEAQRRLGIPPTGTGGFLEQQGINLNIPNVVRQQARQAR